MNTREPRAHLYVDGGGMVTGTHDVHLARRLLVEAYKGFPPPWEGRDDTAWISSQFRPQDARLETGRIVPTPKGDPEYAWLWRSDYEPGKPGVTRAVVWTS